jgi:hypothetical protein
MATVDVTIWLEKTEDRGDLRIEEEAFYKGGATVYVAYDAEGKFVAQVDKNHFAADHRTKGCLACSFTGMYCDYC